MDSSIFGNAHIKYLSEVQELIIFIESLVKMYSNSTNQNINTIDGDYNTALHYIAKTQYVSIAKILINSGADIYMVNKYNRNPIDIAKEIYEKNIESMNGHDDIISYQKMINFLTSCDDDNDDYVSSSCSSINSRDDTIKCIMCMTENKNILVLPCKHVSICEKCFKNIQNKTEKCCICRSRVVDYMRVYIV
jgi:ankyrin repeat protein